MGEFPIKYNGQVIGKGVQGPDGSVYMKSIEEEVEGIPIKFNNLVVGSAKLGTDGNVQVTLDEDLPEELSDDIKQGTTHSFSIAPNCLPNL